MHMLQEPKASLFATGCLDILSLSRSIAARAAAYRDPVALTPRYDYASISLATTWNAHSLIGRRLASTCTSAATPSSVPNGAEAGDNGFVYVCL
ncbi:hypothetical protein EJ06DRAFT_52556 [Trichodelitschia bisporula]|uniref:Uncharacterized protein n=1 Tax=Trichodelitschia bisporula TaxID=703511 RepID=A0A6G1HTR5_9PEZI|nr:hypothetical protein EJ06DRAFT_52556 [Trichodelitschia bisporula]